MTVVTSDPETRFAAAFESAAAELGQAAARCALATADSRGRPSVRMVYHRPGPSGRVRFFTNRQSRKGRELHDNPWASAVFHWVTLDHQVRLAGRIVRVPEADSDAYFANRSIASQWAAVLSHQSQALDDLERLRAAVAQHAATSAPPSRPAHWGGYELVPDEIEFWQAGNARVHERQCFRRTQDGWVQTLLSP